MVQLPTDGDTWLLLTDDVLPAGTVSDWAVRPDCGAVVVFSGTARDHAEGRPDVRQLEYEAYEEQVVPRLAAIAAEARRRWPTTGRLALLHRVGVLAVGETSVIVAASAPHRDEAFEAARFCIDTLKASVPIWKRETWSGGSEWGLDSKDLEEVRSVTELR
ncbi:MAG TPA: molybdenum cofactor biosynthesis protein MoaE [Acidimicrobiales bacterium]|nr:molybdenum cofactor biosynthesis protein MoaE [Acidimicrobiales bacterium]